MVSSSSSGRDKVLEWLMAFGFLFVIIPLFAYFSSNHSAAIANAPSNAAASLTNDDNAAGSSSSSSTAQVLAQSNPDYAFIYTILSLVSSTVLALARGAALTIWHAPRLVFLHTPRGLLALLSLLLQPLHPILAPVYLALEILAIFTLWPLVFLLQVLRGLQPLYTLAGAACLLGAGTGGLARWISIAATNSLFSSSPPRLPPSTVRSKPVGLVETPKARVIVKKEET